MHNFNILSDIMNPFTLVGFINYFERICAFDTIIIEYTENTITHEMRICLTNTSTHVCRKRKICQLVDFQSKSVLTCSLFSLPSPTSLLSYVIHMFPSLLFLNIYTHMSQLDDFF